MAINLDERYPGRANPKSLSYPQGSFKNRTSPTAKDGTYLEQDWANDQLAFFQSLIQEAGMTANGEVDEVGASQYFDALIETVRGVSLPIYPTAPATNVGPLVYVIDRQQILHWQTVGTFTGYVSPNVGRFVWGTSTSPRPDEVDAIGQTVDRTNPRFQALIAWAESNGHMVASGAWTKGAFQFSVISGSNVRMPDLRDQFIRATGTDADTANARSVGSRQTDLFKSHTHSVSGSGRFWTDDEGVYQGSFSGGTSMLFNNTMALIPTGGAETRPVNVALHPRIQI